MRLIDQHTLSDSLRLAGTSIATTALGNSHALLTENTKHLGLIEPLNVERVDPTRNAS